MPVKNFINVVKYVSWFLHRDPRVWK